MLTYAKTLDFINMVQTRHIERLTARTGAGLITDIANSPNNITRLYMGIEGHTHKQSIEGMQDENISEDPGNPGKFEHRHTINGKKLTPEFHDMDFKHYGWQIMTLAPLYFTIKNTPDHSYSQLKENTIIQFIQPLPPPTRQLKYEKLPRPFRNEVRNDVTFISYPLHIITGNVAPIQESMAGIFRTIWDQCDKTNYLYCKVLDGDGTLDFANTLHKKH